MDGTLPLEIYRMIIVYMDSINLISLSQTNAYFRQLIRPQRSNFVERLLALELMEQYGGPILQIDCRHTDQMNFPLADSEAWSKMRWACSGCLKLLAHHHFDSHSILKLKYRKPLQGSQAANQCMKTEWELDYGSQWFWIRKQQTKREKRENIQRLRRDFGKLLHYTDIEDPFNDRIEEESRQQLLDIEREIGGYNRHKRLCNECKLQKGLLGRHSLIQGNDGEILVVKSRPRRFYSTVDRCFPGNPLDNLDKASTANQIRYPDGLRPWNLFMIRCSFCTTWKELTAFRPCNGYYAVSVQSKLDGRCNECYIEQFGKEKAEQELFKAWEYARAFEIRAARLRMVFDGWNWINKFILEELGRKDIGDDPVMKLCRNIFGDRLMSIDLSSEMNDPEFFERQHDCFQVWTAFVADHPEVQVRDGGFMHLFHWAQNFEANYRRWKLVEERQELEKKHSRLLLDYVMDSESYRQRAWYAN